MSPHYEHHELRGGILISDAKEPILQLKPKLQERMILFRRLGEGEKVAIALDRARELAVMMGCRLFDFDEIAQLAEALEQDGDHSVWLTDHVTGLREEIVLGVKMGRLKP